ncbi:MAG: hypothetical protein LBE12_10800 [Planctomycetaceae bacterium]|nr:hypothetical protein [Planctomycetaceae bacterium]
MKNVRKFLFLNTKFLRDGFFRNFYKILIIKEFMNMSFNTDIEKFNKILNRLEERKDILFYASALSQNLPVGENVAELADLVPNCTVSKPPVVFHCTLPAAGFGCTPTTPMGTFACEVPGGVFDCKATYTNSCPNGNIHECISTANS